MKCLLGNAQTCCVLGMDLFILSIIIIGFSHEQLSLYVPKLQAHVCILMKFVHPLKRAFATQMKYWLVHVKDIIFIDFCKMLHLLKFFCHFFIIIIRQCDGFFNMNSFFKKSLNSVFMYRNLSAYKPYVVQFSRDERFLELNISAIRFNEYTLDVLYERSNYFILHFCFLTHIASLIVQDRPMLVILIHNSRDIFV